MKRGKDEGKIMGPMFPRLHVNDTERGGPRAPPRNKMALYEQLSIPSQRLSNSVRPPNSEHASDQGAANERGALFSYQLPNRHQSDKISSQYSDFSAPFTPLGRRKKSDEEEFRVPVFHHSIQNQECGDYVKKDNPVHEKVSASNPSSLNRPSKFHKFKSQTDKNSKEFPSDRTKVVSNSSIIEKQIDSAFCREPTDCQASSIGRLQTRDMTEPELRADSEHDEIRRANSVVMKNFPTLDERNSKELGNDEGSQKRLVPMGDLERADSVSEISVAESIAGLDMTPDDVVGIIGQKHFWKARKNILNQQRVFAVQVFELHRLVKVQRLIAASPQFLLDNTAFVDKPNAAPGPKVPSVSPLKAANPEIPKRKGELQKPSHNKESSAENTAEKPSFSSIQNGELPSGYGPLTGNSLGPPVSSNPNTGPGPWCFNQPQGHQWLIPVMTPSEGLVYKPYPGPGFVGPACGGCGPPAPIPAYGIPAPHPHYQLPSFPHGYFPTYGMPMMNTAAVSGSSVEQTNPQPVPSQASGGGTGAGFQHHQNLPSTPSRKNRADPDKNRADPDRTNASKNYELVETSRGSSPVERLVDNGGGSDEGERGNMLSIFPMAPSSDEPGSSPACTKPDRPTEVIRVVPHNARSATESAARIFRFIQEERKQYDSV